MEGLPPPALRRSCLGHIPEQVFQSISLNLVKGLELLAQFARGETLTMEPYQVGFGQIDESVSLVFAKGHPMNSQLNKSSCIWRHWDSHGAIFLPGPGRPGDCFP